MVKCKNCDATITKTNLKVVSSENSKCQKCIINKRKKHTHWLESLTPHIEYNIGLN